MFVKNIQNKTKKIHIPSLNKSIIQDAIEFLNESNYVLGPSRDGGFYLFGSKSSNNISLDLVKNNDFYPFKIL